MKTNVIAICNQKGGVGKTTTTANLGVSLARNGKRVLLLDLDPQADLSTCFGYPSTDNLPATISTMMTKAINDENFDFKEGIIDSKEGISLLPANLDLSAMEMNLVGTMNRERVLKEYVDKVKDNFDYVLIDCMPSLGMITINALAAADTVIIPVQAHYLPAKGMEQLLKTVNKVKKYVNPKLQIEGVLMTLVDKRTSFAKEVPQIIKNAYGNNIRIFDSQIPIRIKTAEATAKGISIVTSDPDNEVSKSYMNLAKEVINDGSREKAKLHTGQCR